MTADEAIAIAKSVAEQIGWTWRGTAIARRIASGYEVRSNAGMLGCNVVMEIADGGAIIRAAFLPR